MNGRNIQRIMKQYSAYVKFSNTLEFNETGGYMENHHNVISRTPAKNEASLLELEKTILESIQDIDFIKKEKMVEIPKELHRIILGYYAGNIRDIEVKYKAHIDFPEKETGSDVLLITASSDKECENVRKELMVSFNKTCHFLFYKKNSKLS